MQEFDQSYAPILVDTSDLSPDDMLYGVKAFCRVPGYLPYSHWRIKEILRDDLGLELEYIHPGYKGGRYPGYVNKYRIIDIETREVINPRINLYQIRCVLARNGFPLHAPKVKRNPKAVEFLEIFERIKETYTR